MNRTRRETLFVLGLLCMLCALCLQNMTLATGRYGTTLLTALALTVAADACLAVIAWRSQTGWRIAAIATMLPTLFIIADLVRRAPYVRF